MYVFIFLWFTLFFLPFTHISTEVSAFTRLQNLGDELHAVKRIVKLCFDKLFYFISYSCDKLHNSFLVSCEVLFFILNLSTNGLQETRMQHVCDI